MTKQEYIEQFEVYKKGTTELREIISDIIGVNVGLRVMFDTLPGKIYTIVSFAEYSRKSYVFSSGYNSNRIYLRADFADNHYGTMLKDSIYKIIE